MAYRVPMVRVGHLQKMARQTGSPMKMARSSSHLESVEMGYLMMMALMTYQGLMMEGRWKRVLLGLSLMMAKRMKSNMILRRTDDE